MTLPNDPATVYLALGSNLADRQANLRDAVRRLEPCLHIRRLSQVYETAAAYVTDQPSYLNMVLVGETVLDPHALLVCLKAIEREMGRETGLRWGPRLIDLDILLYANKQISTAELEIPHPRLHERPFVLQPLAELAPDLVPPGLETSVAELARSAPPVGAVIARIGPLR